MAYQCPTQKISTSAKKINFVQMQPPKKSCSPPPLEGKNMEKEKNYRKICKRDQIESNKEFKKGTFLSYSIFWGGGGGGALTPTIRVFVLVSYHAFLSRALKRSKSKFPNKFCPKKT